ncbi:MAG: alkaline phosphatase D family protein [Steroidobacteraceae bacterium]
MASGDPDVHSVLLWTRRPFEGVEEGRLYVEISRHADFATLVGRKAVRVLARSDWTCRVLAAGLAPRTEYWYRFVDEQGRGSRIGRTLTAPSTDDARPLSFAFVSCQCVNEGAQNAYRRMIHEDERADAADRLAFVLHLGDFIYEVVEYPDELATRYDRTIVDIGRVPDARQVGNFHAPTTLEGYRHIYRAYLHDPDLQDARARFPFVGIWDNHEFSWRGWQGHVNYTGTAEPAQAVKVAANQAWFEYIPARIRKSSGPSLEAFDPPSVHTAPINHYDEQGLGQEPNNLAAIGSLTAYRRLRFGPHVDLVITDLRSYRMEDQIDRPEADPLRSDDFPEMMPEEAMAALDAGRTHAGGHPPETLKFGEASVPNFRREGPPYTILGAAQKRWFKDTLRECTATWKVWAASVGTLDFRMDPQNLPAGLGKPWPGAGFAGGGGGDVSSAWCERAELYEFIRAQGITGFATVSGDRHSFWAGYAASALPPQRFEPVGVAFITGSISAVGLVEAFEHRLPMDHPLRALYLADRPGRAKPEATVNLTLHRGVRSALEYARSGDIEAARALTNRELAPHLTFVDMAGHGYSVVRASAEEFSTEFHCIERPIKRATTADGGPLRYRVRHRAARWRAGEAPRLEQLLVEGDAKLSV